MKKIITISGYSGSGKSTLIERLSQKYEFDIIKFGMVHRECTKYSGYQYAKDWIKEKGFDAYEKQLLVFFRDKLISTVNMNNSMIIIDGVFSDKCFKYMKSVSGISLNNIVLNTNYNVRVNRIMERENLNYDEAIRHLYVTDEIKQKAGLSNIIKNYDYIIDGNISKDQIMKKCLLILKCIEMDFDNQDMKKEIEI